MPPPPPPQANAGKVTPNLAMDAEATRMLNLTVLQRLDPAVEDILITAAHVTLYDFNIDLNQWVSKRFSLLWYVPGLDHDPIRSDAGLCCLRCAEPQRRGGVAVRRQEVGRKDLGMGVFGFPSGFYFVRGLIASGTCWITCRNSQPRFQFIVMNRRNTGTYIAIWTHLLACCFDLLLA